MRSLCLTAFTLAASAGIAAAAPVPQVIVSTDPNNYLSNVPGGDEGEQFMLDLGSLYRSPSGNWWTCSFTSNQARVGLLAGQGREYQVVFSAKPNSELPWSTPENPAYYSTGFDTTNGFYCINDAGDIAVSFVELASPVTRTIAKRVGGTWSIVVRQGDDIPFVGGNEVYGNILDPFGINQDGSEVYFRAANTVGTLSDAQDEFIVLGASAIQLGVTTLPYTAGRTFDNLGSSGYLRFGQDSSSWISVGNLSGATSDDDVVVTGSAIIAQEGVSFGGLVSRASRLGGPSISGNGLHKTFRSQTSTSIDFVGLDTTVIAQKGAAVPGAPAGTTWNSFTGFSRTFLNSDSNDFGQWVILGGTTTAGVNVGRLVSSFDGVLISDRQGVDADGDGLANDGIYADINGGTGSELATNTLANDGSVYAVIRLVDSDIPGSGAFRGEALVRVGEPIIQCAACAADYDSNGGVDGADLANFFADYESGVTCADVDQNGGIDGADLAAFFGAYEAGGC